MNATLVDAVGRAWGNIHEMAWAQNRLSMSVGVAEPSSRSDVSPSRNQHNGVRERRGGDSPGATSWGKQRGPWEAWMAHTNHTAGTPVGLGAGPFSPHGSRSPGRIRWRRAGPYPPKLRPYCTRASKQLLQGRLAARLTRNETCSLSSSDRLVFRPLLLTTITTTATEPVDWELAVAGEARRRQKLGMDSRPNG